MSNPIKRTWYWRSIQQARIDVAADNLRDILEKHSRNAIGQAAHEALIGVTICEALIAWPRWMPFVSPALAKRIAGHIDLLEDMAADLARQADAV